MDVYTAVGGGVGALYGPLHGGANEAVLRMLDRIKTVDNIPAFIEGVKARKEKLFGFGHRCATVMTRMLRLVMMMTVLLLMMMIPMMMMMLVLLLLMMVMTMVTLMIDDSANDNDDDSADDDDDD